LTSCFAGRQNAAVRHTRHESAQKQAKKSPSRGLGLNPPKEEVEETRYVCLTATTNEGEYMKDVCAKQGFLHGASLFHNVQLAFYFSVY
jgi:hypothetical protein